MRKVFCGALAALMVLSAPPLRADDNDKAMRELLDKAIKAAGGAENLNKYTATSMKMKGTVHVMGMAVDFTGEWAAHLPDKLKSEMQINVQGQKINVIQVLNKDKGWLSVAGQTQEMDKAMLAEARKDMHSGWVTSQLTPLKGKEYKLSPLGEIKVDGKEAVGMRVSRKGYSDVNMYFDKKTHLLAKVEFRAKDFVGGGQEVTQEMIFGSYKDGKEIPYATKITIKRDGEKFMTAEVTDVAMYEKLDDSHFAKP